MRNILFIILCAAAPLFLNAQEVQPTDSVGTGYTAPDNFIFGYFSYSQALKSMPEYARVEEDLATLRKQYDVEAKRVEDEFNRKYEDFLEEQRDLAPSILKKRQNELQDLLDRNVAFREEALKLLEQAKDEALAPLNDKIKEALKQLAIMRGYAFILNTDGNTMPYVDATRGEDINATLKTILISN